MIMPVGRLTLVRTFAKSELVRAMSFVALPALIGPMLGPIAGGLIVDYFHWRVIFFVNVPVGLIGLYLVRRHLPDYRDPPPHPLDTDGFVLFGSRCGAPVEMCSRCSASTRSPVAPSSGWWPCRPCCSPVTRSAPARAFPLLRLDLFGVRTFRVSVSRQLRDPPRHRRHPVPASRCSIRSGSASARSVSAC